MSELIARVPTEAGRWYNRDGSPCHEVEAKSGSLRPATLRDARKLNLVPSVTTVMKLLDRPALNIWIQDQMILAALTLPRHENELDEEFLTRVRLDAKEKSKKAAERGTALHGDIERAIQGKPHGHENHIKAIAAAMQEAGMNLYEGDSEHSFACPDGFGGKTDWKKGNQIADFKSKPLIEEGKKLAWDEMVIQLAAYAHGFKIQEPRAFNVFVGIEDGKAVVHEWAAKELERGKAIFLLLVQVWRIKNGR